MVARRRRYKTQVDGQLSFEDLLELAGNEDAEHEPVRRDGAEPLGTVPVNVYFLDHPDAVLGELRAVHGAYNAEDLVVAASGDTAAALARALIRIAADATSRSLTWTEAAEQNGPQATQAGPRSQQPDGYLEAHRDGTFTQVADGHAVPFPVPASQGAELWQLLGLRDAITSLLEAEAASLDDTQELHDLRQDLNLR